MTKKILALVLALILALSLGTAAFADAPTDEEMAAWAEEHGYVKLGEDLGTSATESGVGGVNYGAIPWTREMQVAAVREFLKGGPSVADPAYAQDETGWSYRNMFQMATCYNNVPNNTNLELVLDAASLSLLGISEAGTSKTQQFAANPTVCIAWSKQLRDEDEEAGYTYYASYGLSYYGDVIIYTTADLETEEGQNAVINLFDKYYITYGWAAYYASFKDAAEANDEAAIREGKLAYINKVMGTGAMVVYEIVPTRIAINAPFLMVMNPQMNNSQYTTIQEGEDKYAYDLGITDEFIDMLNAYKLEWLADEANKAAFEEYYTTGTYAYLNTACEAYGLPTSLEICSAENNACGIKTQTVWTAE